MDRNLTMTSTAKSRNRMPLQVYQSTILLDELQMRVQICCCFRYEIRFKRLSLIIYNN